MESGVGGLGYRPVAQEVGPGFPMRVTGRLPEDSQVAPRLLSFMGQLAN